MDETRERPEMEMETVISTLKGLLFGNFELSQKQREALDRAVTMIKEQDETINKLLEVIGRYSALIMDLQKNNNNWVARTLQAMRTRNREGKA